MKIFVSSLISGMEPFRHAARKAIKTLGHDAVMAEDFGPKPVSPQVACLQGVRESSAVLLVLGAGYGVKQASGLSPTHEEYREARDSRPVIAFVQSGVSREPDQQSFVDEVQSWDSGLFRGGFATPEDLGQQVTRRLYEWHVSTTAGPVDEKVLLNRALSLLPEDDRHVWRPGRSLLFAVAAGPRQQVMRPAEIERSELQQELVQDALFGPRALFSHSKATTVGVEDGALAITHAEGLGQLVLHPESDVLVRLPLKSPGHGPIVIEEDVAESLAASVRHAAGLLDRVDRTQRLTHVALATKLSGGETVVWRTRLEQAASPDSYTRGFGQREPRPVHLSPGHRPRAALAHDAERLVEDLVTLLRREWKS